jgi:hypothetical protein
MWVQFSTELSVLATATAIVVVVAAAVAAAAAAVCLTSQSRRCSYGFVSVHVA